FGLHNVVLSVIYDFPPIFSSMIFSFNLFDFASSAICASNSSRSFLNELYSSARAFVDCSTCLRSCWVSDATPSNFCSAMFAVLFVSIDQWKVSVNFAAINHGMAIMLYVRSCFCQQVVTREKLLVNLHEENYS